MKEVWKPVKGFEDYYSVSNLGRVKSEPRYVNSAYGPRLKPGKIMRPYNNGNGYLATHFYVDKKRTVRYIHRLVAEAFIDNPLGKPEVNHLDYDRMNNVATNLEWSTDLENTRYSADRMRGPKKTVYSNTGERYVTYRKSRNEYRLTIPGDKEYRFKTLDEAVAKRRALIGG